MKWPSNVHSIATAIDVQGSRDKSVKVFRNKPARGDPDYGESTGRLLGSTGLPSGLKVAWSRI